MGKVNPFFRCPNCFTKLPKDSTLMHLASGTTFSDAVTGRVMSAAGGGYKEVMYCSLCQKPLKMKLLIDGKFDERDHSFAFILVMAAAFALLYLALGWGIFLSLCISLVPAFIVCRILLKYDRKRFNALNRENLEEWRF